ncbi:Predicted arabinose efflux permease, MFS family [Sulfobacillus thermosulfidooxidans DSM 9293]|uniref:Predicted arabinose efflux permease, MFS family n=1 Tax=Sulfobacillus thermosulfidooxidans (strain DSM 9293 / VKM B-1269 / AT-1) TaxID=929705 RepID=A0A1W1WAV1_SULTA|nr:MFS transporter [Sulfobacillus thermosulfidooxidans]SMC03406.1 Predicted arabinose efflux permease, MFS family [Sulfobacillus thermosulfidooxidans DSM 9293]
MPSESTGFQSALDHAKLKGVHWKVWFLSAMGVFLDGFDLFIIGVALPLIAHQMHVTKTGIGLIGAAAPLGAMIGAFTLGRFTDKLGRKAMYLFDLLFFVVFAGLSALSWNPTSLLVFRFLLGIGIGADYPISSTYVSELMPKKIRGRMLSGAFSFQALGALFGAAVGLSILMLNPAPDAWRIMLAIGVVPAVAVMILRTSVPESPRWKMEHGDAEGARALAEEITGQSITTEKTHSRKMVYKDLFRGRYLTRTILVTVPWFLMDIGLYGIGIFTPTILSVMAFAGHGNFIHKDILSTQGAIFLDVFLVIGFALSILLIEKLGRIRLQLLGFAGMGIAMTLLAFVGVPKGATGSLTTVIFIAFALFNLAVNTGPNATTWILPTEVFPTSLRASGHGLAAASGKFGAAVGIFLLPVIEQAWGLGLTLGMIAAASFLGFLVTWAFGFETAGKSLEEAGEGGSDPQSHQVTA